MRCDSIWITQHLVLASHFSFSFCLLHFYDSELWECFFLVGITSLCAPFGTNIEGCVCQRHM